MASALLMINCKAMFVKAICLFTALLLAFCVNNCCPSKEEIRVLIKEETNFRISDFEILKCERSIAFGDQIIYINLRLGDILVDSLSLLVRKSNIFDPNSADPLNYYPYDEADEYGNTQNKRWYKAHFGYKFVHILDTTRPEYVVCRLDTIRKEFDYRYIID